MRFAKENGSGTVNKRNTYREAKTISVTIVKEMASGGLSDGYLYVTWGVVIAMRRDGVSRWVKMSAGEWRCPVLARFVNAAIPCCDSRGLSGGCARIWS